MTTETPPRPAVTVAERAVGAATILVLLAVGWVLLGPEGTFRAAYTTWHKARLQRQTIAAMWDTLVRGARLDRDADSVVAVVFADYECPYCSAAHGELSQFLQEHPQVGVTYRHLPLTSLHPMAFEAAEAASCASKQDSFLAMHNALYERADWQSNPDWERYAREVGVADPAAFVRCLEGHEAREGVIRDQELAGKLGITGTPSFVFRDRVVGGSGGIQRLKAR